MNKGQENIENEKIKLNTLISGSYKQIVRISNKSVSEKS